MKQYLFLTLFNLSLILPAFAQLPFTLADTSFTQMGNSYAAWGDYDNDGDLDIALTGDDAGSPLTQIYRNDTGSFILLNTQLPGVNFSSCEWGDYEPDGDLDLLITGYNVDGTPKTLILKNNSGNFTGSGILLPGVAEGQATWGDFDNDLDLDILMAGKGISMIYRNDGNDNFVDFPATLLPVWGSFCNWVDYNNDGRLDAFVAGDAGMGMFSNLYRNDSDTFSLVTITPEPFLGLGSGRARWADLNLDGRTDLLITGMDFYGDGHVLIYQNDGNDQFTMISNYDFQVKVSCVDIGDYDADGLPDWILMGRIPGCGGTAVTMLYHNEGFMLFFDATTGIPGYKIGSLSFGDYDNNGFTDLLITGLSGFDEPRTSLYRNNAGSQTYTPNTPPDQPAGLTVTPDGDDVVLTWHRSADGQTPPDALTYNIFMGTQATTSDVFGPMSDLTSGIRLVPAMGNTSHDTTWKIRELQPGTYYWSVQAIDNGFLASGFSPVESFDFTPVGIAETTPETMLISPNPVKDQIRIKTDGPGEAEIVNSMGKLVYRGNSTTIDVSSWSHGIYILKLTSGDKVQTARFIK